MTSYGLMPPSGVFNRVFCDGLLIVEVGSVPPYRQSIGERSGYLSECCVILLCQKRFKSRYPARVV